MKRFLTLIALVFSANFAQIFVAEFYVAQVSVALAFQETEVPVTSSDVASHANGMKTPLSSADNSGDSNSKKGTVLHIPGFGAVGTLPKLDFGLELLYRDDEIQTPDVQTQDDISIKGRIKHNF